MKKLIVLSLALIATILIALPVLAAPRHAVTHQVLGDVLLRTGTTEAQVSFSTVDGSRIPKRSTAMFQRGVIITDDNGRVVSISGDATVSNSGNAFQVFDLTGASISPAATKNISVTQLFVGVMTGDFDHPITSCASPNLDIATCLDEWLTSQ